MNPMDSKEVISNNIPNSYPSRLPSNPIDNNSFITVTPTSHETNDIYNRTLIENDGQAGGSEQSSKEQAAKHCFLWTLIKTIFDFFKKFFLGKEELPKISTLDARFYTFTQKISDIANKMPESTKEAFALNMKIRLHKLLEEYENDCIRKRNSHSHPIKKDFWAIFEPKNGGHTHFKEPMAFFDYMKEIKDLENIIYETIQDIHRKRDREKERVAFERLLELSNSTIKASSDRAKSI